MYNNKKIFYLSAHNYLLITQYLIAVFKKNINIKIIFYNIYFLLWLINNY